MNQEQFQGQKLISAFLWTFQNFKKHPHQRTPDSYSSRCFSIFLLKLDTLTSLAGIFPIMMGQMASDMNYQACAL